MLTRQPALRFFRREDLEPYTVSGPQPMALCLTPDEIAQLETFCEDFSRDGERVLRSPIEDCPAHLRMFIAFLAGVGAVRVSGWQGEIVVRHAGRLSRHVPQILSIYIKRGYALINDWRRSAVIHEDRITAVEFVHQLELRRITLDRKAGIFPQPLAERPVAFGVFRAVDKRGRNSYLFEMNKDWLRLNFIGGKQEQEDNGDYGATLKREISEELGIDQGRVTLTRLNDRPIVGYSLSGNVGSLASYPCVLFGVSVAGEFGIRPQDQWISAESLSRYLDLADSPIMVNPAYLSFLLEGKPSRLESCPLTTQEIVETSEFGHADRPRATRRGRVVARLTRIMRENKELVAAGLTIAAALITFFLAI